MLIERATGAVSIVDEVSAGVGSGACVAVGDAVGVGCETAVGSGSSELQASTAMAMKGNRTAKTRRRDRNTEELKRECKITLHLWKEPGDRDVGAPLCADPHVIRLTRSIGSHELSNRLWREASFTARDQINRTTIETRTDNSRHTAS